ncbi:trafficking protein particle complex subunit 13-like [Durio zibethinus]|uniref:Trafficking protein particle complex subunit 13-like n=1 Tax=Durio zibethinus TaxID=66656 RepID=A0A6P5X5T2_DURZI|nr:trafficking protein particle complex subunit 13-like [Durio zibethinus]
MEERERQMRVEWVCVREQNKRKEKKKKKMLSQREKRAIPGVTDRLGLAPRSELLPLLGFFPSLSQNLSSLQFSKKNNDDKAKIWKSLSHEHYATTRNALPGVQGDATLQAIVPHRTSIPTSSSARTYSTIHLPPLATSAIYLGETFFSYISINNSSNFEVRDVIIKAEIQTERQRILLLDTSKSPVESIRAGGCYDFIVEHDVKELGAHTLVCTVLYHGDGKRKYLPQFFKFVVANPLSVRTKVRTVKETTYLEACIENHTKSNLYMDQVEFEPAPHWIATILKADEIPPADNSSTGEIFKPPILIRSGGGIHNYLYQLKLSSPGSAQVKLEGTNILGNLQITWHTNLGEPGRSQTQQILGTVHLNLTNHTDRELGPFEVWLSQNSAHEEKIVTIYGLQTMALPQVKAFGSIDFHLNLIAVKLGVQKISGITVSDTREKKTFDPLPDVEIFVESDWLGFLKVESSITSANDAFMCQVSLALIR